MMILSDDFESQFKTGSISDMHQLYSGSFLFQDIDFKKYEKERLVSRLLAKKASYLSDRTLMFDRGATFYMYGEKGDILKVRSKKAQMYFKQDPKISGFIESQSMEKVHLWDRVVGKHPSYRFDTQDLTYFDHNRKAISNSPITFTSEQIRTSGNRLEYYLDNNNYTLAGHVRGAILPSKDNKDNYEKH